MVWTILRLVTALGNVTVAAGVVDPVVGFSTDCPVE
jgi:hypothetical protein